MDKSIGIFDSGVGGLSVMREMIRLMPNENYIYLGDTARVPYGNKSPKTILQYSIENISFLLDHGIKLLVIACNTVCAYALDHLEKVFPIPIMGVIKTGFDSLIQNTKNYQVAILGTVNTLSSGIYQNLILKAYPEAKIHSVPCPLFVPLTEEGFLHHPLVDLTAKEYLEKLNLTNVDSVLLACTHYPLIYSSIRKVLSPSIQLVDPSKASAVESLKLLKEKNLLSPSSSPKYQFYVTDNPERFKNVAEKFLGMPISRVDLKFI